MRECLAANGLDFADNQLVGLTLKWYTDNQNIARIVHIDSRKEYLQKQDLSLVHYSVSKLTDPSLTEKSDLLSYITDHNDWAISVITFSISWNIYRDLTL